jgi:cytochrome c oxidase subunit 2
MVGRIVVMQEPQFERWLSRQDTTGTLAAQGKVLFSQFGCGGCHGGNGTVRAPPLEGLYGKRVPLNDGTLQIADERYLRDSILRPRAQIVASYQPLMPSYEGKVSEDELVKLVAYLKSLGGADAQP